MNFYNEIDPYAAQWLRNLIDAGHIAYGVVDERDIRDILPDELVGYTQCHFFAGLGGWPLALRRAGWPDDRPVWTGSCPCQPFSTAGKGNGFDDERHLWPSFQWLIEQRRPSIVFGEQVASKAVEPWIDLVHADLEALGYAFGCVPFPSAGVGAPHIRDRAYWVGQADAYNKGLEGRGLSDERTIKFSVGKSGVDGGLADAKIDGYERTRELCESSGRHGLAYGNAIGGMADTGNKRLDGFDPLLQWEGSRRIAGDSLEVAGCGPVNGLWRDSDWLYCRDDRWRPVEPGTFPLAHGISNRVGRLRAYGNAINVEAAKKFIIASM